MKELEDGKTRTDSLLFKILVDDGPDGKYFNFEYLKLKFKVQNKVSKIIMVDNDNDLIGHKVFVVIDKNKNRVFKCECGVEMDRDIHAAKNMVWFYEYNVGVGRTNVKRVEMQALVNSQIGY